MNRLDTTVNELQKLVHYRYFVERYHAGLKRLTLVARPITEEQSSSELYITFTTVEYIQMPTYWENASFHLKTLEEGHIFFERIGFDIVGRPPLLFYSGLDRSEVFVVCYNVEISEKMPP